MSCVIDYHHVLITVCQCNLSSCSPLQYAILLIMLVGTIMKYILHTIDLQNENPWENKVVYMLYADVVLGECLHGNRDNKFNCCYPGNRFLEGVTVFCIHEFHVTRPHVPSLHHEEDLSCSEVS